MKFVAPSLIKELIETIKEQQAFANTLSNLSAIDLNHRINETSWSILECLEHLNRYGAYYITAIKLKMHENTQPFDHEFQSGWLGNYFALSMLPKPGFKKMNTFKNMNPIHSKLSIVTIETFQSQLAEYLEILEHAKTKNLNKIKISITISKFIKLKLGDTFRFVINHNTRHLHQIKNIIHNLPK